MGTVQSLEEVLSCPIHWTVALPATLREVGVDDLLFPLGLDYESFGTARMMARYANEARSIVGKVDAPDGVTGGLVLVERLPVRTVAELDGAGLSLREIASLPLWRTLRS